MKKGKSTGIQILRPVAYWERKLNIYYDTAFIRYKKLCVGKLGKRERHKLDGHYYITYSDWERTVVAAISSLNESELYEYIHFLYGRTKNSNFIIYISSSVLFPIITSFVCTIIFRFSDALTDIKNVISIIILFILFVVILIKSCKPIIESRDDSLHYSFYKDLAHIAEKRYKELTEK